ncbi:Inactive serine/threonine-protein kinase tex14 [Bulinus truncatus]|nr:Inactive serine/threonine-protein kinase tex14 [Bulinus truncatus]
MQNMMNSLRSRKIVDQMRSFLDKYSTSNQQYVNLIELGNIEETDSLGSSLHRETVNGNRRALKKVLQSVQRLLCNSEYTLRLLCNSEYTLRLLCNSEYALRLLCNSEYALRLLCYSEYALRLLCNSEYTLRLLSIFVDYPNDQGQTPLFCACSRNVENTALLLLRHGANPNEKSFDGLTPAHGACYMGNVRLLGKLIEAGADLRLHDNKGRSVRDWAQLNPDPNARSRMIDFLDRTHTYAMSFSGDAVSLDRFTKYARRSHRKTSLMEIMRMRTGSDASFDNLKRVQSMGFGKVYLGTDHSGGIISVIPMISESVLYRILNSRFETGPVSFMEKMTWLKTTVTVKQLNHDVQQNDGLDLLITDAEFLGKIRHPNVLLLMAITQSTNFDSLLLVFENIKHDNLYHFLHQKGHRLPFSQQMALIVQVSSAMEFIHSQSLIHCGLSSMAIYLVSENYIKVGNFEYMVESVKANMGRISLVSTVPHGQHLYNWMAPELIVGNAPCFASDVYSFSCIVWELFTGEIPWEGLSPEAIRRKVVESGRTLDANLARLPLKLKSLIIYGLVLRHDERLQKFTNILEWLSPELYGNDSRGKNRSGNFAAHSKHSSPPSSTVDGDGTDWTMDSLHFTPGC